MALVVSACGKAPSFKQGNHPTHAIEWNGKIIATELLADRLAVMNKDWVVESYIENIDSPHFLAIAPNGALLVSEGWGSNIVSIDDLEGNGLLRLGGFHAPHGVTYCNGYIYIADSLNGRLVRVSDIQGANWDVFADYDHLVAYGRQLDCYDGVVYVANSYEPRPGLNPGQGGNVLRIANWDSGLVEEIVAKPFSLNGLMGSWFTSWGEDWSIYYGFRKFIERSGYGVPYGISIIQGRTVVSHFGDFENNKGGFLIL